MPTLHDYVSLISYGITFFIYLCITWITSQILLSFLFRQRQTALQVVPVLTVHVTTWWLCAILGELTAFHKVVFWRPEPIYNKYAMFLLYLFMQLALNWVHVSQFFITFERILIMKSTTRVHNEKLLFWLCITVNVIISLLIGILFVIEFIPNANTDDGCASIGCLVSVSTYLISYHISNAISVINLLASVYFLLLYRKFTHTINKTSKQASKILNVIKFTICIEICLDIVPQMVSVGLSFHGSIIGSYFKYFAWILFACCGVCVNRHIHKALLVNAQISIVKTTSNMVVKSNSVNQF